MIQLEIDTATFRWRGESPMTGVVVLRVDGQAFPLERWDDFVAPILCEWAEAMRGMLARGRHAQTVCFMDGPYEVRLARADGEQLDVVCVDGLAGRTITAHGDARALARSAVACGELALAWCEEGGRSSRDIVALRRSVDALRSALGA